MRVQTIEEFGVQLVKTGDLDPVYTAIHSANLDEGTKHRLVLAYWCFYSLAAAARLAEAKTPAKYWELMEEAATFSPVGYEGKRPWPRGGERRHFRGWQAQGAMNALHSGYKNATDAVMGLTDGKNPQPTYHSVSQAAQRHRGMGPWIAFKIADMSERILGMGTDFTDCELGIYKDPRQGAALAWVERCQFTLETWKLTPWAYPITNDELQSCVEHHVRLFQRKLLSAPPTGDRLVNVQEIETIFCKYKSYRKGHYPPGKDIREISHGLSELRSDLGDQLLKGMPTL